VVSVPKRLRGFLADRPQAVAALTQIFLSEIERLLCEAAGGSCGDDAPAAPRPRPGAVSFLHRFGSAMNRHVPLHASVTDGVFTQSSDGYSAKFFPARPITTADLATLTERVRRRVVRWFRMQRFPTLMWPPPCSLERTVVFRWTQASGSRSLTAMYPAIFRVWNSSCDTAPGRPLRWSGSP